MPPDVREAVDKILVFPREALRRGDELMTASVAMYLLVDDAATIKGGSARSSAARTHSPAIADRSIVVFPVPGGPLTARMSPFRAVARWASTSR
ncbi:hypothetical protein ASE66_09205 [Bosea sp. Root483D1]|nr:hypothetical protein ASE66_09205 [Bosea sp. Root483D1]